MFPLAQTPAGNLVADCFNLASERVGLVRWDSIQCWNHFNQHAKPRPSLGRGALRPMMVRTMTTLTMKKVGQVQLFPRGGGGGDDDDEAA